MEGEEAVAHARRRNGEEEASGWKAPTRAAGAGEAEAAAAWTSEAAMGGGWGAPRLRPSGKAGGGGGDATAEAGGTRGTRGKWGKKKKKSLVGFSCEGAFGFGALGGVCVIVFGGLEFVSFSAVSTRFFKVDVLSIKPLALCSRQENMRRPLV